jgi:hypothetical protein
MDRGVSRHSPQVPGETAVPRHAAAREDVPPAGDAARGRHARGARRQGAPQDGESPSPTTSRACSRSGSAIPSRSTRRAGRSRFRSPRS